MNRFDLRPVFRNPALDQNSAEYKVIEQVWKKQDKASRKRLGQAPLSSVTSGSSSFIYPNKDGLTPDEAWVYSIKIENGEVVSIDRQKEGKPVNFGMQLWLQRWPWVAGGVGLTGLAAWGIYTLTKKR
jgi:hypothetical protein